MRAERKKIQNENQSRVICGLFSKKEAAEYIAKGHRHVHSSSLGEREECARITHKILLDRKQRIYPWELIEGSGVAVLTESLDRHNQIRDIASKLATKSKKDLVESVFEELLTNAIYHAYSKSDGTPKYHRREVVRLAAGERVGIKYGSNPSGFYLAVKDQAGSLNFPSLAQSFGRCYAREPNQIETKDGGAGLGLYMVFESVTHLRIDVHRGRSSEISCWIPEKLNFDPDSFSFNFFERE